MDEAIINMGVGALGGGILQYFSEGMKVTQMLAQNAIDTMKANNQTYRQNIAEESKTADAAGKRSTPWLRATLAITVFLVAFVGLWINGFVEIPTSLITEKEPWLNLFGILRFGSIHEVTTASGFVMPPYFAATVQAITGFVFGVMAVRTGKRI